MPTIHPANPAVCGVLHYVLTFVKNRTQPKIAKMENLVQYVIRYVDVELGYQEISLDSVVETLNFLNKLEEMENSNDHFDKLVIVVEKNGDKLEFNLAGDISDVKKMIQVSTLFLIKAIRHNVQGNFGAFMSFNFDIDFDLYYDEEVFSPENLLGEEIEISQHWLN
jgi:nitrate reductase NapAB chaperone NapD